VIDAHANAVQVLRAATHREQGRREWHFARTGVVRCSAVGDAHAEWSHGDAVGAETWGDREAARIILRGLLAPELAREFAAWVRGRMADADRRSGSYNSYDPGRYDAYSAVDDWLIEMGVDP
jgi:hypothetical protein